MPRQHVITQQNLLHYSQDLTNGVWQLDHSGGSLPIITGNYSAAPDGTMTATRVQLDISGGGTYSRIHQSQDFLNVGYLIGTWTFSAWLKTNDGSTKLVDLRMDGVDTTVTVTGSWQRLSATSTNGGYADMQILLYTSAATSTTADLSVWGAQLVQANWPGYYTPTTSSSINTGNFRNLASLT